MFDIRPLSLSTHVACPQCEANAVPGSDYCAACVRCRTAARRHARVETAKRVVMLVLCLLFFAAVAGWFCPLPFLPLLLLAGFLAAIPFAAIIVGSRSETHTENEYDARVGGF